MNTYAIATHVKNDNGKFIVSLRIVRNNHNYETNLGMALIYARDIEFPYNEGWYEHQVIVVNVEKYLQEENK